MKWFLTIAAIIMLAVGLYVGLFGHDYVMLMAFGGFVALLVAANLDRISEFKASKSGFEARTREVSEVIAEAKSTVSELQLLARNIGELTLSLVKRSGRFGGYNEDEKEKIKSSVLDVLRKVGIPESEFSAILTEWYRFTEFDYAHGILGGSYIPESVDDAVLMEWESLREGGIVQIPDPETLRAFLSKHNFLNEEFEELLKDYEFFCSHKIHRRPDVWQNRQHWGRLRKQ